MTTPQLENGYTRIANEILEALAKINLSPYETRIIFIIWRKTYGYQKPEDWISWSQLKELTGISPPHISRTLRRLFERKIVTKNGNKLGFNKDYKGYCELPKLVTVTSRGNSVTSRGKIVTCTGRHKRNYTKETITKERKEIYKEKKLKYLNFVFLTAKEYLKLKDELGEIETNEWIERVNDYIGSTGKKYKSHYFTILNWNRKEKKGNMTRAERRNIEGEKAFMEKHKEDILKELKEGGR